MNLFSFPLGCCFLGDGEFGISHPSFCSFLILLFCLLQVARKFLFFPSSLCLQKVQSPHFSFFHFLKCFCLQETRRLEFPFLECCCYLQMSRVLFFLLLLLPKGGGGGIIIIIFLRGFLFHFLFLFSL